MNESTNFTTELAAIEFSRLCALEIGFQWFEQLKQIVQIHFTYKALADQETVEIFLFFVIHVHFSTSIIRAQ